jgi:YD repeat-containing protein
MRRAWILLLIAAGLIPAATIMYEYDASGRLLSASYDNGTVVTYAYDNAGNLLSRSVSSPAAAEANKARIHRGDEENAEVKRAEKGKAKDAGAQRGRKKP